MLHLNLAVPNCAVQEHAPATGWITEVVRADLRVQDGYLLPPEAPGLGVELDEAVHAWLGGLKPGASPRDLGPVPVFGYPGWAAQDEAFYDDARYFRPLRAG